MPPIADDADWSSRCRDAMACYAAPLLREVAAKLVRPRANQPIDELLDKAVGMLTNPPVIDRRIRDLPEPPRKLLAIIGLSRADALEGWSSPRAASRTRPRRRLRADRNGAPSRAALSLFVSQFLRHSTDFTEWFGGVGMAAAEVFAHPAVADARRGEELGLPDLSEATTNTEPIRAADGLDWPLRLAAVWQQVLNSPVRSTQGNTLFKKDLARLQTDEVLSGRWAGEVAHPPDLGVLALLWAAAGGLLAEASGELTATPFGETLGKRASRRSERATRRTRPCRGLGPSRGLCTE